MYLHIFWSISWITGERNKCLLVDPRTAPVRALGSLRTWIKTAGSHILKEKAFSPLVPPLLQPVSVAMLLMFLQYFEISLQRFHTVN